MHFKPVRDDNDQWVPGVTGTDGEDVPAYVTVALRGFGALDLTDAQLSLTIDTLNAVAKASYDRGFDGGYANGLGAGRRLERAGE